MNSTLRALVVLACYIAGVILIFVPWSGRFWEHHRLLERYPELIPYLLNPYVRGAISGLGVLDILIAVSVLRHRPRQNKLA